MTTKKKFPFLKCFSKNDIATFPNGWIAESKVTKHVLQGISSDDDDDLVGKIIFIKPNIWGQETLKNEYWKADTYHPTLKIKDVRTMDTEIFLVGKIEKETNIKKDNKRVKRKQQSSKTFETVLMCDSSKDQANEFSEKQCWDMLIKNIKGNVRLKLALTVDCMTENDISKEIEQLEEDSTDTDSNDDNVPVTVKRELTSGTRKITPKKKPQRKKQIILKTKNIEKKKRDFMIGQRVAFDFYSEDFQKYVKDWDKKTVNDHKQYFLEDGKHIFGIIDSKVKKQKIKIMQTT